MNRHTTQSPTFDVSKGIKEDAKRGISWVLFVVVAIIFFVLFCVGLPLLFDSWGISFYLGSRLWLVS